MIDREGTLEIRILYRQGVGIREIARRMGIARNTVRRHLACDVEPVYGPRTPRPGKLEPFKDYIAERLAAAKPHWVPATVIHRELEAMGTPVVSDCCAVTWRGCDR